MYPEVFHVSFLHTYGVLVALAFLSALWMAGRLARREGLNGEAVTNLGIYCALAAIAGAKLMMFLVDWRYYREHPDQIFSFATLQAGGIFFGGFIGALLVAWWYMRAMRLPTLATADVFAPAIALGHGIGRLGCFSAGCCWGIACTRPWAVTFTNPVAHDLVGVPLDEKLHPTQIYEALAEFCIFGLLYWRFKKPHTKGSILGLYMLLYPAARFVVEFFRFHDQPKPFGGPLNLEQWISLGLMGAGAALYFKASAAPAKRAS